MESDTGQSPTRVFNESFACLGCSARAARGETAKAACTNAPGIDRGGGGGGSGVRCLNHL